MAKFKMIVLTSPVPGKEEAFHHWYQNIHLPELLETAGMLGAQRYQRVATLRGADDNGWLAIYDIECDDPQEFLSAMKAASAAGKRTGSDAVDLTTAYNALFAEYGDRVLPEQ